MQKAIKALTLLRMQEYGDFKPKAMVFPQGQDTCHAWPEDFLVMRMLHDKQRYLTVTVMKPGKFWVSSITVFV